MESKAELGEMDQRYRNVFASNEGIKVLGDILTMGHFFETLDPENKVAVAEHNFAKVVAYRAGLFDRIYPLVGIEVK